MRFSPQPVLAIAASIVVGGAGGLLFNRSAETEAERLLTDSGRGAGDQMRQVDLLNVSEDFGIEGVSFEKKKEVLKRTNVKFGSNRNSSFDLSSSVYPTEIQMVLAKLVYGLSEEETIEVLDSMYKRSSGDRSQTIPWDGFTSSLLIEHLSELDPQRALEFGVQDYRKMNSRELMGCTVNAVAQKNGPEALSLLETLPERGQESVVHMMSDAGTRFNGSLNDVIELLRRNPALASRWVGGTSIMGLLLGKIVAQNESDPVVALASVRDLAIELVNKNKPGQTAAELQQRVDGILGNVAGSTVGRLLEKSPAAALAVLEILPEGQKGFRLSAVEAGLRIREQGIEAAIQFAETQETGKNVKDASGAIWRELAKNDRAAAIEWAEALPEGMFREGVFGAWVRELAHDRPASGLQEIIEGANVLRSDSAQMDYFSELIQVLGELGNGRVPVSPSEIIERLPLAEGKKQELYRRFIPIKS